MFEFHIDRHVFAVKTLTFDEEIRDEFPLSYRAMSADEDEVICHFDTEVTADMELSIANLLDSHDPKRFTNAEKTQLTLDQLRIDNCTPIDEITISLPGLAARVAWLELELRRIAHIN